MICIRHRVHAVLCLLDFSLRRMLAGWNVVLLFFFALAFAFAAFLLLDARGRRCCRCARESGSASNGPRDLQDTG